MYLGPVVKLWGQAVKKEEEASALTSGKREEPASLWVEPIGKKAESSSKSISNILNKIKIKDKQERCLAPSPHLQSE